MVILYVNSQMRYTRDMTKYEGTKLADFEPIDKVTELQIIDIEPGTGTEVQP